MCCTPLRHILFVSAVRNGCLSRTTRMWLDEPWEVSHFCGSSNNIRVDGINSQSLMTDTSFMWRIVAAFSYRGKLMGFKDAPIVPGLTWTSKLKYFLRFLIIMTRKGSLIPRVFLGSCGHVIYVVDTLVPSISRTRDWISLSVMRLMWPLRTFLSQICSGLEPIEYRIDRNPA